MPAILRCIALLASAWAAVSVSTQVVALPTAGIENQATLDMRPSEQQTPDSSDIGEESWKRIGDFAVTPDGRTLVYHEISNSSLLENSLVVQSTRGRRLFRYNVGRRWNGFAWKVSPTGRWLAYISLAAGENRPDERTLSIINLADGSVIHRGPSTRFHWVSGEDSLIAISEESTGTQLSFLSLSPIAAEPAASVLAQANNLAEIAIAPRGNRVAWSSLGGVSVLDFSSSEISVVASASDPYIFTGLSWSDSGDSLAFVKTLRSSRSGIAGDTSEDPLELVTLGGIGSGRLQTVVFDRAALVRQHPGYTFCPVRAFSRALPNGDQLPQFVWRTADNSLFLSICQGSRVVPSPATPGSPIVWTSEGNVPPGRPLVGSQTHQGRLVELALLNLDSARMVRLTSSLVDTIEEPALDGNYIVGFGWKRFGWKNGLFDPRGSQLRDYYLIDIRDGSQALAIPSLRVPANVAPRFTSRMIVPQLSPDQRFLIFQREDELFSLNLESGRTANLTMGQGISISLPGNNPESYFQFRRSLTDAPLLQGWTSDQRNVLISDYNDVWLLSLTGDHAVNLTQDGRTFNRTYERVMYDNDFDEEDAPSNFPVVIDEPLYFKWTDNHTGTTGLTRWTPDGSTATLDQYDGETEYYAIDGRDEYFLSRENAAESRNLFAVETWNQPHRRITDLNPQQRSLGWAPRPRRFNYTNEDGVTLRSILYLPFGYVNQRTYPTVVIIYEGQFNQVNSYVGPNSFRSIYDLLRRGYAVLVPDILPRVGEPGPAALEGVNLALDAVRSSGIVDESRLALYGHSYGGYEALFIIAHSRRFAAAIAYAGYSNLVSYCGGIYGNMTPSSQFCEFGQASLGLPLWRGWDRYLLNSPLYSADRIHTPLLLIHGDADLHVPFAQSVELFNLLRNIGGRQVVLLQYQGGRHSLEGPSAEDAGRRKIEWLDHFLRDEALPLWATAAD